VTTTSIATFLSRLYELHVEGVKVSYEKPPRSLQIDNLPAKFPRLPEKDDNILTFQAYGGLPTLRCELVIAIEPFTEKLTAGNEFSPINFEKLVTMADNLNDALRTLKPGSLTEGPATWSIRQEQITVNGVDFWAIVAPIEGKG